MEKRVFTAACVLRAIVFNIKHEVILMGRFFAHFKIILIILFAINDEYSTWGFGVLGRCV